MASFLETMMSEQKAWNRLARRDIRGRVAAASLHLFEAAGELAPMAGSLQRAGYRLRFARTALSFQNSIAIGAAYRMGLFEILDKPRKVSEIAILCDIAEPATRVLLDAVMEAGLARPVHSSSPAGPPARSRAPTEPYFG